MNDLKRLSITLRQRLLQIIYGARGGHTGGSLSSLDILIALYFHAMKHRPEDPAWPGRDRFILSKGHSVEGYYCVLAEAGYFPREELDTYGTFNSRLFGHPTMKTPGVEIPTGALGHGLSVGVGMAIAGKRDGASYRVYVLMGDGEQAEGSVWEAAMAASHYHLGNLVGIIDNNNLQISGNVDSVMRIASLEERWASFGWMVHEVDGNDLDQLTRLFDRLAGNVERPQLVIAHTVKGKGISFMENNAAWHHRVPTPEEMAKAQAELSESLAGAR
ncbi:MAG TPA: transketolase [Spirochaetia bacterium]|nr:transketolase [Spirochaetia bacterium]